MTMSGVDDAVDRALADCDREPIHVPGSIQPHGALIAFVEPSLVIVAASGNCGDVLGLVAGAGDLVGRALADVLGADDLARLLDRPHEGDGAIGLDALPVTTTHGGVARRWMALIHRHEGLAIVEFEPVNAPHDGPGTTLLLDAASRRLQATTDVVQACQVVVEQVRRITGFARVKLYRFASDWSGEVLGESRDDDMPSYLGLHFPASDIPPQARALYQANPVRLIADVRYTPSPLTPDRNPTTGRPIDLRFATLRSVSPVHLEYLRNMGTGASMSASIVRDGALWGLIACHHRAPLLVDFERRQACALLAQLLASRLDAQERVERAHRNVRVEGLRAGMLRGLGDGLSIAEAVERHADDWMRLVGAGGFALVRAESSLQAGATPPEAMVRPLAGQLVDALQVPGRADHVASDRVGATVRSMAVHARVASGVLAVPLSRTEPSWLMWFRPELLRTVTWAGKPAKVAGDAGRLHPRHSFDAWVEEVSGRSLPWTGQDVAVALQLREMLLDLMLREKDALERENTKLALSSRELETFIYVASHDIKEPLRQMEMLTSLLRAHVRDEEETEVVEYLREFRTVAARLRALTDQLANYARLGRTEARLRPVALDELIEEVSADLRHVVREADCELVIATSLPVVAGEREQLHQVFVNLLGNAIKYRAADRRLRIEIAADTATDPDSLARPTTRITVADNGIGFDARFADKVFDAFVRLHSRDRYEGTGIGLAICRRIVERHGGRIEATAAPDVGATFVFTLPLTRDTSGPS